MTTDDAPTKTAPASGAFPWAVWSLSALFYSYIFFVRVAPSVMVGDLMQEFAVNAAILGNLSAVYFYAYASLQLPVGVLHDRFGPRRVLTVAAVLCTLGTFLFATADQLWVAYVGRLLMGTGGAFALVGSFKVASIWHPPRRFALLTGLAITVGMAGAIGGQAPLAALVAETGWRWALTATAVFGTLLAAAIWLIVRDQTGREERPTESVAPTGVLTSLAKVVRTPQSWYMSLICGATGAPVLAFASLWGVPYMMVAHGIGRPAAAISTSFVLVGFAVGGPVFGWFSDYIGRRKVQLVAGTTIMSVSFAVAVYVPGLPLWLDCFFLFTTGLAVGSCMVCYAVAREHNLPGAVGATTAVVNMMGTVFGGALQPVIGWVLDLNWDGRVEEGARIYSTAAFEAAFLAIAVVCAASIGIALLTRETYCRQVKVAV